MAESRLRAAAILAAAAVVPGTGKAQSADAMIAKARALTSACPKERQGEIVVCGRTDASRYRVPLSDERDPAPRSATQGLGQIEMFKTQGACAPVGPRRCTKREALSQGLGGDRNPLDQAIKLGDRLINGE